MFTHCQNDNLRSEIQEAVKILIWLHFLPKDPSAIVKRRFCDRYTLIDLLKCCQEIRYIMSMGGVIIRIQADRVSFSESRFYDRMDGSSGRIT